ncbi:MAG TPA: exo-alpha-sialidase, partial [Prolixibacteraceae bacterium]|nr:exo-alpha-sialidase [Prolixibacteraceae bacterium]
MNFKCSDNLKPNPESIFQNLTQKEIREYEMDVMRRIADFALIPPFLNTTPLPEYDYDQLDYGMNLGIAQTPGGRIWAAWVAGGDSPKAFIVINMSDDGETWSKPCLVVDSHSLNLPMNRTVIVGNLWIDPIGRLWFFFDQVMHHFDGRGGLWYARCDNPDSDSHEWTSPIRIWHGSMLNKPTVLSTGEWLFPVQLIQKDAWAGEGNGPFIGIFNELDPYRGANVFSSTNKGISFQRIGCVQFPKPSWPEHMIVELNNGDLWMLARTQIGIMESYSMDKGYHWSEPSIPRNIQNCVARFHVRRLLSGRILLVKHGDTTDEITPTREKIKAFLSEDDGKTWTGGLMLDERSGVSYPDGYQTKDGRIYISYDYKRSPCGHILMARITEEDILAEKLVSP